MKNKQKGSVNVFLIILVVVLVVAVVCLLLIKKPYTLPVTQVQTETQTTPASDTPSASSSPTVSGMQQYTDSAFGFSFWHLKEWTITKTTAQEFPNENITTGTVVATVHVGDNIKIEEVHSTNRTIVDNIKNFGQVTYTFDTTLHAWMTTSSTYTYPDKVTTTPLKKADINENTMGGLHMFPGVFPYKTLIIPLSASNFLVIDDETGDFRTAFFARTIIALDPSVATPVSTTIQTKTIQTAAVALTTAKQNSGMQTFSDTVDGFSFQYPTNITSAYGSLSWQPSVFVTKNKNNIDSKGCYIASQSGENGTADETNKTINGIPYCLSQYSDAGAGSVDTDYYYTTYENGMYITIGHQVHNPNGCQAYEPGPGLQACEDAQKNYATNILKPIEQSVGSLKFY